LDSARYFGGTIISKALGVTALALFSLSFFYTLSLLKNHKPTIRGANNIPAILGPFVAALHLFLYVPDIFENSLKTASIIARILIFTALASSFISMVKMDEEVQQRDLIMIILIIFYPAMYFPFSFRSNFFASMVLYPKLAILFLGLFNFFNFFQRIRTSVARVETFSGFAAMLYLFLYGSGIFGNNLSTFVNSLVRGFEFILSTVIFFSNFVFTTSERRFTSFLVVNFISGISAMILIVSDLDAAIGLLSTTDIIARLIGLAGSMIIQDVIQAL
jgi:hypothetical protein